MIYNNKFNNLFIIGLVEEIKSFVRDNGQDWFSINLKVPHDFKDFTLGCNWFRISFFGETVVAKGDWVLVTGRIGVGKFTIGTETKYRTQITSNSIINLNHLTATEIPAEDSSQILDELKRKIEAPK